MLGSRARRKHRPPRSRGRPWTRKLAEEANTELYKKRGHTIEPVFGNIKANLGYRRFSVRSLPAVNSEWRLICTAHNLLKLQQTRPA